MAQFSVMASFMPETSPSDGEFSQYFSK